MIINQAKNLFDVHCDGCGESQAFQGVYNKSQLADAIKTDGWIYKYTEDKEKFRHFCRKCVDKSKESKEREIREKLLEDLRYIGSSLLSDYSEYWEDVINQALEIIEKEGKK